MAGEITETRLKNTANVEKTGMICLIDEAS